MKVNYSYSHKNKFVTTDEDIINILSNKISYGLSILIRHIYYSTKNNLNYPC